MALRSVSEMLVNDGESGGIPTTANQLRWLANHLLYPGLAFAVAVTWLGPLHGDLWFADQLYTTEGHAWSLHSHFVTEHLLHVGGRHLSAVVWLGVLLAWMASWRAPALRPWRKPLLYLWVSVLLSTALVSVIKRESGLDCPWDLLRYGGDRPYFGWFSTRPAWMPPASCFPAGHAGAGYAWIALYFFFLDRRPAWRWRGLAIGLIAGATFGIAQQLRGAHFFSHDLWTLMICWSTALLLHVGMLQVGTGASGRAGVVAVIDNASETSTIPASGPAAPGNAR
ncbi:phosphatase PAP2 family protein [Pseudoxanthomonas sp. UTMC 1351]|uniref:phosphatase PAP2 family protein n=1 Tax=Pseudoxanthomonas sp. UTMC 1351 TaxID=2695853 RepID=UPI0034CE98FC